MIEKDRKLSYLMSLGHWEVSLLNDSKNISAVYICKYKRHLLFETSKLYNKNDITGKSIDFKIFLPSFIISGSGTCVKIAEVEGIRNEVVIRFMLDPEKIRIKQQRHYKRLPVFEKARFELKHQTVNVIVKDISLQGIGLYTTERIRGETGILTFFSNNLMLNVQKIHEFTDFNLFQYGMKLISDENNQKLKAYLLSIHEKIRSLDFVL